MIAPPDVPRGDPHRLAVLDDLLPGGDVGQGQLVAERHRLGEPHADRGRPAQVPTVHRARIEVPYRDADQVAVAVGQEARCARRLRHVLLPGLAVFATGLGE
jgi:hypothetical protein